MNMEMGITRVASAAITGAFMMNEREGRSMKVLQMTQQPVLPSQVHHHDE